MCPDLVLRQAQDEVLIGHIAGAARRPEDEVLREISQ
jgi:hypothetical protein